MTKQQRRKHKREILNEIGQDWVSKEKAMLGFLWHPETWHAQKRG